MTTTNKTPTTIGGILNHSQKMSIDIGDKSIDLSPLTISDLYSHFESKVRQKKLDTAKELASCLDGPDRVDFMMKIYKEIPTAGSMDQEVTNEMNSVAGIQEVFFKAAKNAKSTITHEEICAAINLDTISIYLPAFYFILGQEPPADNAKAKPVKNSKAQKS